MRSTKGTAAYAARMAPPPGGRGATAAHSVQFYDHDDFLVDTVADFIGRGLAADEAALVIATPAHRTAFAQRLSTLGIDAPKARARGQYLELDAAETLKRLLRDGRADEQLFRATIGRPIEAALRQYPRLRAFGEMVALLREGGNGEAALRLEELWNRLGREHAFSLLCAYPFDSFTEEAHAEPFLRVCRAHTQVLAPAVCEEPRPQGRWHTDVQALVHTLAGREAPNPHESVPGAESREEFLVMLGRELRRPLAPIANAVQLLRLSPRPHHVKRACDVIERQARRLARLTDDLLDAAGVATRDLRLNREMARLADIVERAVHAADPAIHERGHRLSLELPTSPVWLFADAARLERVLVHLLHGTARYADLGSTIRLHAYCQDEWLTLAISDSGSALSPELREHASDKPPVPAHATAKADEALLGLALARTVLALHGGTLEVTNDTPEGGSGIALRLPLRPPGASHPRRRAEDSEARTPRVRRFLIVDDDLDAADALGELLQAFGHRVRVSYSGRAALEMVRRFRPEIVLVQLDMPEMDGCEVARRLRAEHGACTPVLVAVAGFAQECDAEHARRAGFDRLVIKPLDARKLESLSRAAGERDMAK